MKEHSFSNCCSASVDPDIGICSDCKEHCGVYTQKANGTVYCEDCKSLLGKYDDLDEGHKCN